VFNSILREPSFFVSCLLVAVSPSALTNARGANDPLDIDLKTAVARGDLHYSSPTTRSEEGMPLGNGRMGSLVWTTPSALKFQINRCDVFGVDSTSVSFPQADTDYASGCGYVDIHLASAGPDVFAGPAFHQRLSLYDGTMTATGAGVSVRALAWNARDVIALEIDDQRVAPEPINIDLRMLRYATRYFNAMNAQLARNHAVIVQTANHYATSQLHIREGAILLTQRFVEQAFFDSSAIAIAVAGRESKPRFLNETTVQLSAAAARGKFTVLIASAATFDRAQDVGELALRELTAAKEKAGFDVLAAENERWWHDFWTRGYVAMHSADGQADFVGGNYLSFLYLMAASSRGAYPPRFGGMLWYTNGDMRRWGSQYWHANTDAYYRDLMPSGHLALMDPFFALYFGMHDTCALAARQQWGTEGIYIPEVTFFNGPEPIPEALVSEFQDLFLARKPYAQASREFLAYVQTKNCLTARYNFLNFGSYVNGVYVAPDKGAGIFGHCTHFLSGAAGVASMFWQRYEFTGDRAFLRDRAYPMIKGVAEFYAHFPNLKKEADGKFHIYHVNRIESDWDSQDTPSELGAMRTIFPLALQASQLLGVDEALRPRWQDIAENLAAPLRSKNRRGSVGGIRSADSAQRASVVESARVRRNGQHCGTRGPLARHACLRQFRRPRRRRDRAARRRARAEAAFSRLQHDRRLHRPGRRWRRADFPQPAPLARRSRRDRCRAPWRTRLRHSPVAAHEHGQRDAHRLDDRSVSRLAEGLGRDLPAARARRNEGHRRSGKWKNHRRETRADAARHDQPQESLGTGAGENFARGERGNARRRDADNRCQARGNDSADSRMNH
jgi:hypothetical protein